MRSRTGLLACATIVAACSAAADLAPSTPGGAHRTPVDAAAGTTLAAADATPWQQDMRTVKAQLEIVRAELRDAAVGDLVAVAAAANRAAELLRGGYGAHEANDVPDFARMAREAEAWCLSIATEARLAHGAIARELFRTGVHHCTRCHDAVERVRG